MAKRHIKIQTQKVYQVIDKETGETLLDTPDLGEAHRALEAQECEAFNIKRQGMCKRLLDVRGECPEQHLHGDEFEERR